MVRWSQKETKILLSLFENHLADPFTTKSSDIDAVKGLKDEFKGFSPEAFRKNYKNAAVTWFGEKSTSGMRREELKKQFLAKFEAKQKEDKKQSEEEEEREEEATAEDSEIENMIMPKNPVATSSPIHAAGRPRPAVATRRYKPNETPFFPRFNSHVYPAKNFMREQIIIELPGSFTGAKGTYEAYIDEETMEFVFKIPPNDIFTDPHSIHSYQTQNYARNFGGDCSAKTRAFKESVKGNKNAWPTFRHSLQFKATKSVVLKSSILVGTY